MIKWILGEKSDNPKRKIVEIIIEKRPTIVKHELILFSFLLEFGKNLIRAIPIPSPENVVISPITDMIVVAKPISFEEKRRALIIQKKNPNPLMITDPNIKNNEFLKRESFLNFDKNLFILITSSHPGIREIPKYDEVDNEQDPSGI